MNDRPKQTVVFFGTPTNFAKQAKLQTVILRLGERLAYMATSWYMQMRDLGKQSSTFGEFSTNTFMLVGGIGAERPSALDPNLPAWVAAHVPIWQAFDEADVIDLHGDPHAVIDTFRVVVHDLGETNVTRKTRDTHPRRVVSMTNAERQAVKREQKRRVAAGLPRMSDDERDSWVVTRRDTTRHDTTQGDTGKGREEKGREDIGEIGQRVTGVSQAELNRIMLDPRTTPATLEARFGPLTSDGSITWAMFIADTRAEYELKQDRKFMYASQLGKFAIYGDTAAPLHDTSDGADNALASQSATGTIAGDALNTTDTGSQPRVAVTADNAA